MAGHRPKVNVSGEILENQAEYFSNEAPSYFCFAENIVVQDCFPRTQTQLL